jgi:ABC-type lipoprotein export system ATPase subunit
VNVAEGRDLRRSFGRGAATRFVVNGVDLTVRQGEMVALVGPSGSGKTTLLHLLSGFDTPSRGSVTWAGVPRGAVPRWDQVAVVPQSLGLLAELSFVDHLLVATLHRGRTADARARAIDDVLAEMDISAVARRLPEETSLGQQQRLAVGRALVVAPQLVVADEPTSHQDQAHAAAVAGSLRRAVEHGGACLVSSHDPVVIDHADRVITMIDGRITPQAFIK